MKKKNNKQKKKKNSTHEMLTDWKASPHPPDPNAVNQSAGFTQTNLPNNNRIRQEMNGGPHHQWTLYSIDIGLDKRTIIHFLPA